MIVSFLNDVRGELAAAREKHPSPILSYHEGYAIALEELQEYWNEVCKKRACRDEDVMYWELVQTAAMCARIAEDRGLVDYQRTLFSRREE